MHLQIPTQLRATLVNIHYPFPSPSSSGSLPPLESDMDKNKGIVAYKPVAHFLQKNNEIYLPFGLLHCLEGC